MIQSVSATRNPRFYPNAALIQRNNAVVGVVIKAKFTPQTTLVSRLFPSCNPVH